MIILISGKQGSGKTTLQKQLATVYRNRSRKPVWTINFADQLYKMHDAVLDVLHETHPIRPLKKDGYLLQVLGTEWGRKTIGENIWVDALRQRMQNYTMESPDIPEPTFIIGDCRFENEFDAFPDALRIRLECPEEIRKVRCEAWRETSYHPSETGLDAYTAAGKFDLVFDTGAEPTEHCIELIIAQLRKNSWIEKRK